MVQKRVITFTSDISGAKADETLLFGLDGKQYEIDLTATEAAEIREFLAPYISVARKQQGRGSDRRRNAVETGSRKGAAPPHDPSQIRAWARDNGIEVPGRGRIPTKVWEQFAAAHGLPQ